jgi:hypothetical protein
MARASVAPLPRNLPPKGIPWTRIVSGFAYSAAYICLATFSIMWSLGYRVNPQAATIEQTGLLELGSPQIGLDPTIQVNGVVEGTGLPFRKRWVLPGSYDVVVTKEGYQTWEKRVTVRSNERITYPSILLLYREPRSVDVPAIRLDELTYLPPFDQGIVVKEGTELWIRDKFITRTSQEILAARWVVDGQHVLYQVGSELILYDVFAQTSQAVLSFGTNEAVPYAIRDGGRIIVYAISAEIRAVALFDAVSIIDRLTNVTNR